MEREKENKRNIFRFIYPGSRKKGKIKKTKTKKTLLTLFLRVAFTSSASFNKTSESCKHLSCNKVKDQHLHTLKKKYSGKVIF